ncbi:MAG: glycosyltransferase family 39 protein [Acidimicrobiia bacterium]
MRWIRRERVPIVIIVGAGFLIRLAWLLHADPVPVSDFNDYRTLAVGIVDHGQFGYPEPTSFFLPLHPVYLSVFAFFSRSDVWLGLSMVVLGTISIGLVYLAALRVLATQRAALIAAGLFAFYPTLVLFSPILATEHLFVALMLGAIAVLTRIDRRPAVYAGIVGILVGCAVLTRGEAVFYVPAILLFIWVGNKLPTPRTRIIVSALVAAGIFVVVLPWYVRNAIVVDPNAGLSSSAGLNFYFAHNDSGNYGDFIEGNPLYGLPPEEASRLGWELGFKHIREHPLNLVKDVWKGTLHLFASPDYSVFWATQQPAYRGDPEFVQRYVRFATTFLQLARMATAGLLAAALLSLLAYRAWRRELWALIIPLAVSSWLLRTVIYWAKPRYAYFVTVILIFVAAFTIDVLVGSNRRLPRDGTRRVDVAAGS